MNTKELLKKRKELKSKKPEFIMQDAHKRRKLPWQWKRPRGSGSKMRVGKRGYKRSVEVGWGSPCQVKGLDRNGMIPVIINNAEDLQKLEPKTQIAVISSRTGTKNRITILEQALNKKIQVSNYKDIQKTIQDLKNTITSAKKEKQKIKDDRKKKAEETTKAAEKKKEKKQTETTEQSEEEKKAEEKKEKDKVLITKQ